MSETWNWIQGQGFLGWGLIACGAGLFVTLVMMRMRFVELARHWAMWQRVARMAGLGRRERALLMEMARVTGVRNPASLVLGKGCFEWAREMYLKQKGEARAGQLRAIEGVLFVKEGSPMVVLESIQDSEASIQ